MSNTSFLMYALGITLGIVSCSVKTLKCLNAGV